MALKFPTGTTFHTLAIFIQDSPHVYHLPTKEKYSMVAMSVSGEELVLAAPFFNPMTFAGSGSKYCVFGEEFYLQNLCI